MQITELKTSRALRYNLSNSELKAAVESIGKLHRFGSHSEGGTNNFKGERTYTLTKVVNGVDFGLASREHIWAHNYFLTIAFEPARTLDYLIRTDEIRQLDNILQLGFFHEHSPHDEVKIAGLRRFTYEWSLLYSGDRTIQLKEGNAEPKPTYTVNFQFPGFLTKDKDVKVIKALEGLFDNVYLPERNSGGLFTLSYENSGHCGGLALIRLAKRFEGEFDDAAERKVAGLYEAVKTISLQRGIIVNAPLINGKTLGQEEGEGLEEMVKSSQPESSYESAAINTEICVVLPHYYKGQTQAPVTELKTFGKTKLTPNQLASVEKWDKEHQDYFAFDRPKSNTIKFQQTV